MSVSGELVAEAQSLASSDAGPESDAGLRGSFRQDRIEVMTMIKTKSFHSMAGGCCICGLRSSTSRFTSSDRYSRSFLGCFGVSEEERSGDICNPCVLKVKRFNALPKGSDKNWFDTVDSKKTLAPSSMSKSPYPSVSETPTSPTSRHTLIKSPKKKKQLFQSLVEESPLAVSPIKKKHFFRSKRVKSAESSPGKSERKSQNPRKTDSGAIPRPLPFPGFFDSSIWIRRNICCGIIYEGPSGAVALDHRFMFPCDARRQQLFCPLNSAAIVNGELNNNSRKNEDSNSSKVKIEDVKDERPDSSALSEAFETPPCPLKSENAFNVA